MKNGQSIWAAISPEKMCTNGPRARERMFHIIRYRETHIKILMTSHFTTSMMTAMVKKQTSLGQEVRRSNPHTGWWSRRSVQPLRKTLWQPLETLDTVNDLAFHSRRVHKRNENICPHETSPRTFMGVGFISASQGNSPNVHPLINKTWPVHTAGYCSSVKRIGVLVRGWTPETLCSAKEARHEHRFVSNCVESPE